MTKTGGARAGAGRPRGTLNRRSVEVLAAVADGLTPLEYILSVMRDDKQSDERRAWAAEKAAPFFHAKPAPLARSVQIALPATDTPAGVTEALAAVVRAVSEGVLAPTEAQSLIAVLEAQRKAIETSEILTRLEALEEARGG